MSGPAILAIGSAIGTLAGSIGKLILAMASPGSMAVFSGLIDGLALALTGLADAYTWLTSHVSPGVLHDIALAVANYVATKIWAITTLILNAVLDANPIGLVITAVALLVFGIIELVKHWDTARKFIEHVWDATSASIWNAIWARPLREDICLVHRRWHSRPARDDYQGGGCRVRLDTWDRWQIEGCVPRVRSPANDVAPSHRRYHDQTVARQRSDDGARAHPLPWWRPVALPVACISTAGSSG